MCVNKKRPELKCLGQCYLDKKVEEQQKQEAKKEEFSKGTIVWLLQTQSESLNESELFCLYFFKERPNFKQPFLIKKDCLFDIFHPPCIA